MEGVAAAKLGVSGVVRSGARTQRKKKKSHADDQRGLYQERDAGSWLAGSGRECVEARVKACVEACEGRSPGEGGAEMVFAVVAHADAARRVVSLVVAVAALRRPASHVVGWHSLGPIIFMRSICGSQPACRLEATQRLPNGYTAVTQRLHAHNSPAVRRHLKARQKLERAKQRRHARRSSVGAGDGIRQRRRSLRSGVAVGLQLLGALTNPNRGASAEIAPEIAS